MSIIIKNLTKTYKVKKGADVRALKGISFNLPDRGMVFVLGKSGCGKSTLLNVLGGLDGFDGGDIIVDGKSIKDYKARDMDVYRNDYVGFVFQENNLLESDSVRRNVSLALDLQSIKDKEGNVDAALESVELKGYEDRKCNSISGGQKQRVAIARALIKQPKLLLCDEPTGALDSETGAGIFALLKQLSGERLVVVVSHDRESAEKYGDRVIELKDGEIMSDSAPLSLSESGAPITENKKHGGLRFMRALSIGIRHIAACPVRMTICLFLCLITFTAIGFVDSMNSYHKDKALFYTMEESGCKLYSFGNYLTVEEAEELSSLLDVERFDFIYSTTAVNLSSNMNEVECNLVEQGVRNYARIFGYVEADGKFLEDYELPLVAGRLPENTGEVALPLFIFNFFKADGYDSKEGKISINTYSDLIGKNITLTRSYYDGGISDTRAPFPLKVTGIVDTFFNYQKQADILFNKKPLTDKDLSEFVVDILCVEMETIHYTAFMCKGFNNYFHETFLKEQSYREDWLVKRVIAPYRGSDAQKMKNLCVYKTQYHGKPVSEENNNGSCYSLTNYVSGRIENAEDTFDRVNKYAPYVSTAAIVITVLFLTYYASGTISDRRREIGILRALGASRLDILKVSGSEHGVFAAVSVALSSAIAAILVLVVNNSYTKAYGISTVLIRFGIRQFAVVAAVAIAAVIAGIAFPLYKLLKSKPVDIIADRK